MPLISPRSIDGSRNRLLQRLRRLFGWKSDDAVNDTTAHDFFNRPPQRAWFHRPNCPKCNAQDYSMRLTNWIIGPGLEHDGVTSFVKVCNRCGTEWADE